MLKRRRNARNEKLQRVIEFRYRLQGSTIARDSKSRTGDVGKKINTDLESERSRKSNNYLFLTKYINTSKTDIIHLFLSPLSDTGTRMRTREFFRKSERINCTQNRSNWNFNV